MTFEKGHPGGPGRPRGSRSRINLLLDQLAADNVQEILNKVMEAARDGDRKAQDIILRRMWSVPKGRPIDIALPPIKQPADLVPAHAAVVAAMTAQEISPEEATDVTAVLEAQRRAFELVVQEERVEQLETQVRRLKANLA
ncbi:MAG: hypothetical protein ACHQK9_00800 [Reyranellales bacterium]